MNKLAIYIVLIFIGSLSWSQGTVLFDTSTSTINSEKIKIDKAPRIFSQAKSVYSDSINKPQNVSFNFNYSPEVKLAPLKTNVAIYRLKIKSEDRSKSGFIKLGGGNYASTLLDAYYGSRANSKFAYGIGLNHLASANGNVNKKESSFSNNKLGLHTKYFLKNSTLNASAYYQRRVFKNYGYIGAKESIGYLNTTTQDTLFTYDEALKIPTNEIGALISIESSKQKKFSYTFLAEPKFLKIHDTLSTFNFSSGITPKYEMGFGTFNLPVFWTINSHNNQEGKLSRNLIAVSPFLSHISDDHKLNLDLGFITNITNDSTLNKGVSIYPLIKATYIVSESKNISLFGELSGGIKQNNLLNIYDKNPWIRNSEVKSSNEKIVIKTALELGMVENLNIKVKFNYTTVENFNYFKLDTTDLSYYTPEYSNNNVSVVSPGLELSYGFKKGHKISLETMLYSYTTENDEILNYIPKSESNLILEYKVNKKIKISSDISYISGLVGENLIENTSIEMGNILDLNLKAEYLLNKKLNVFLYGNNLLNKNYEFYRFYSVNGLNVLGGLTYSF